MAIDRSKIKEEFIKLLEEDREFRYAIAGLLGLEEILKRIDKNTEAIIKLQEQVVKLQEQVAEHSRAIKSLQEQLIKHSEVIEKLASSIQAIGMRYGIFTEEAFREGIKYLIKDLLKEYKVDKWIYYDKEGYVYGHSSIIEVDVLVKDKEYILVEYKSMVDKSDVAELYRIGKLFEREEKIKPKLLIVSPSIRKRAKELAEKLGIEVKGKVVEI